VLRRIQGVRFGRRTTLIVIAIALAIWALVVMERVRDFVPEELRAPAADTGRVP